MGILGRIALADSDEGDGMACDEPLTERRGKAGSEAFVDFDQDMACAEGRDQCRIQQIEFRSFTVTDDKSLLKIQSVKRLGLTLSMNADSIRNAIQTCHPRTQGSRLGVRIKGYAGGLWHGHH
jgi:hypothetical protein